MFLSEIGQLISNLPFILDASPSGGVDLLLATLLSIKGRFILFFISNFVD
jgi:hypothetical protein